MTSVTFTVGDTADYGTESSKAGQLDFTTIDATCVAIVKAPVAVESITMNSSARLVIGETTVLETTISPADATNKDITWTSDNEAIATVSNGTVTAVSEGTATITATTVDGGKTATCVVTVVDDAMSISEILAGGAASSRKLRSATVVAIYANNIIIKDNTGVMLLYASNDHGLKVGDIVDITGEVKEFYDILEFASATITKKSSGNEVDHGTAQEFTNDLATSLSKSPKVVYIHATGEQNGKNINVGSNTLYYGAGDSDVLRNVEVYGYVYGYYTDNGTHSFIATSLVAEASWELDDISVENGKTSTATIQTNYDGELSVVSNDNTKATATISGKTITVTGVAEGTTTLSITGAATDKYLAVNKNVSVTITESTGAHNYHLVEADQSDWRGDYLIAYSSTVFMDGSLAGGKEGVGKAQSHVDPGNALSDKVVSESWGNQHYVSIEAIDDADLSKGYVIKSHSSSTPYFYHTSSNTNGMSGTANKNTAAAYPISVVFVSSSDIQLKLGGKAEGSILHYNKTSGSNGEMFRFYNNGGQDAIYMYKKQ